jgi:two-component system OmpR family sensor kinase
VTAPDRTIGFDGPDALMLIGDRDRLRQALTNLVQNAIGHTPEGTRIEVVTSAEGDAVVVEVHDDAGLIPSEHLPRIFDRSWRGDESGGSHGLGLSIVRRIVDEHGGAIETSSTPERGTRFRIVLPRSLPLDAVPSVATTVVRPALPAAPSPPRPSNPASEPADGAAPGPVAEQAAGEDPALVPGTPRA